MQFFYSRVSTEEQNEQRQLEKAEGYDKVYLDKISGKNTNRPELQAMLSHIRSGDTVTVCSIDRLGRNTRDILDIVNQIKDVGATFCCLSPKFDTNDIYGEFFLGILAILSDLERKQILERQRQGIEIAKRNGKYKGRKPKQLDDFGMIYKQWKDGGITAEQAGKLLDISRSTFYRRVQAYELQTNPEI